MNRIDSTQEDMHISELSKKLDGLIRWIEPLSDLSDTFEWYRRKIMEISSQVSSEISTRVAQKKIFEIARQLKACETENDRR